MVSWAKFHTQKIKRNNVANGRWWDWAIFHLPQNFQAAVFPHDRKGNNASLRFGRRIPIDISHHGDKGSSLYGSSNRNLFKKIAEPADSTGLRKERFLNKEIAKISQRVPVLSSVAFI